MILILEGSKFDDFPIGLIVRPSNIYCIALRPELTYDSPTVFRIKVRSYHQSKNASLGNGWIKNVVVYIDRIVFFVFLVL
jgi:hypothetical protein